MPTQDCATRASRPVSASMGGMPSVSRPGQGDAACSSYCFKLSLPGRETGSPALGSSIGCGWSPGIPEGLQTQATYWKGEAEMKGLESAVTGVW